MAELNLTPDKRAALTKLVRDTIAADPYPSPRIRRLKSLLAKHRPEPRPGIGAAPPVVTDLARARNRTAPATVEGTTGPNRLRSRAFY